VNPGDDDDAPRWDHQAHYDAAMRVIDGGTWDLALVHAVLALYRLLEQQRRAG
jgi:hypothetical protein